MNDLNFRPIRRLLTAVLLLLLFALALAGCGGGVDADDYTLTSWDWALQRITAADGAVTAVPNPDLYTILFNADGTLTGLADCNNFGGSYTEANDGLQIMLGPTTLMACGDESLGGVYLDTLSRVTAYDLGADGALTLRTANAGEQLVFLNAAGATTTDDLDPTTAGFLGLPWWAWGLLVLAVLGLLWWLLGRGEPAAPPPGPAVEPLAKDWQDSTVIETPHDDLTRIEGIGPQTAVALGMADIHTFARLADTPVVELQRLLEQAGLVGDPTTWPQQATLAAAEMWNELAEMQARLNRGREV